MTKKEFLKIIESVPDDAKIELYYTSKHSVPIAKVVVKTCFVESTTTIILE
jgi:hypothetical protein